MANAKEAQLIYPIPTSMKANAPDYIPLWYYDYKAGKWIEDGEAMKVSDTYVGVVTHLTSWNVDYPWLSSNVAYDKGKVSLLNGVAPFHDAVVKAIYSDSINNGIYVDVATGEYVISLPALTTCTIYGQYMMQYFSNPIQINVPQKGDTLNASNIVIDIDTNNYAILKGRVIDGSNKPISGSPIYLCPEQDWGNI